MTPIFNSLGSNYSKSSALAGFASSNSGNQADLIGFLEERYHGQALLTYKGREAMNLALQLIAQRDQRRRVVVTGFTCYAVYQAITSAGFTPIYLDIESDTLNFSAVSLKELLTKDSDIGAVIVQNTLGFPADVLGILETCRDFKVALIEDLAHSIGTVYTSGEEAGTLADFTILSFSQDKSVDGVSGGALIVRTSTDEVKTLLPSLIPLPSGNYWRDRLYPLFTNLIRSTYAWGFGKLLHWVLKKMRLLSRPLAELGHQPHQLSNWHCWFVLQQFYRLADDLTHRRRIAQIYSDQLNKKIVVPASRSDISIATVLRFPIRVSGRGGLIRYLGQHGFYISDIWYDAPIAPPKYLASTNYQVGQCPNAEKLSREIVNLPTHINITESQATRVAELINQWILSNDEYE